MKEKTWGADADEMLVDIVSHMGSCHVPNIRHEILAERMQFGFVCACGQRWMIRLMPFKSYDGKLKSVLRNSKGRDSMADVLNQKGSMEDLRKLACVTDVMEE
jgi:hypothetical protein